jgi:hypothetical protein
MEEVNKTTSDFNKIEAFRSAYSNYKSDLSNYKNELNKFDDILKQVRIDHNSRLDTGSSGVYTNDKYVETADNVIMKRDSNTDDLTSNSLDGNNYVSDKTYFNYKNLSNQFVQYNPHDELEYQSTSVYIKNLKKLNNKDIVDLSQNGDCDETFLRQCDAYAKMSNKLYYGLRQIPQSENSSNKCECYTFTEERLAYTDDIQEASATNEIVEKTDISFSYLGVLFDGNVYTLKDINYSNNFDNLFEVNTNTTEIITTNTSDLNPFTGKGVYKIELGTKLDQNFGFAGCPST